MGVLLVLVELVEVEMQEVYLATPIMETQVQLTLVVVEEVQQQVLTLHKEEMVVLE